MRNLKTLVFTATFNEVDNIESLLGDINLYLPDSNILIIDDSSPDGTGLLLDRLSKSNSHIHVIHRPFKMGLGSAHLGAMKFAIENDYDYLITMDADYSHHPKYLPEFINTIQDKDFVIGSRYISGGKCEYGFARTLISRIANGLTRWLLKVKTYENTTSYRCFSINLLKKMRLTSLRSNGYSFFIESIYEVHKHTNKIEEFPIHFEDRMHGKSKISKREILTASLVLFKLFIQKGLPFSTHKK